MEMYDRMQRLCAAVTPGTASPAYDHTVGLDHRQKLSAGRFGAHGVAGSIHIRPRKKRGKVVRIDQFKHFR